MLLYHKQQQEIIDKVKKQQIPVSDIATEYNVTPKTIYGVLKKHGVPIRDIRRKQAQTDIVCAACGNTVPRRRCEVHRSKTNFCSRECYLADRIVTAEEKACDTFKVREYVGNHFHLLPAYSLHLRQKTGGCHLITNVVIFRNRRDHILYHRDPKSVKPLIDFRTPQKTDRVGGPSDRFKRTGAP